MAEEEEGVAPAEKAIRIQRVFINLLDSYSSRNIGKVSGGGSKQNPSPQLPQSRFQAPKPGCNCAADFIRLSPKGPSIVRDTGSAPAPQSAPRLDQPQTWKTRVLEVAGSSRFLPCLGAETETRKELGASLDYLASWGLRSPASNQVLFPLPPRSLKQETEG